MEKIAVRRHTTNIPESGCRFQASELLSTDTVIMALANQALVAPAPPLDRTDEREKAHPMLHGFGWLFGRVIKKAPKKEGKNKPQPDV
ncbi:hypothetical protein MKZ38_009675 [Zalerion maritima]|uniref:Uncharacterized protein n=1 Tax=Zalerion maritima TaxID=339359 RepID=A0AAD5RT18_9PEZI|nr:hypothetical protein MKZ38_009675 [Zalerion maritima]